MSWLTKVLDGESSNEANGGEAADSRAVEAQVGVAPQEPTVEQVHDETVPELQDAIAVQGELIVGEDADGFSSLALLSQAHRAIAEARSLDELKGIRDKAEAARKYAQAAGLGLEIQNFAAEVKLRAERRAGSLLAKLQLHGGDRRETTAGERIKLEDIGITKDQSSRWQLTAAVPEKRFLRYIEETRDDEREVTTAGLVRLARQLRGKKPRNQDGRASEEGDNPAPPIDLSVVVGGDETFRCFYADPPWQAYADATEAVRAMSELGVGELAADTAHCHLWAGSNTFTSGIELMRTWGFNYRGFLLTVGDQRREGSYWAEAHEFLLLGVRGELPFQDTTVSNWIRCERDAGGYPSERVRKLIERVSLGPYLELFARRGASGWTCCAWAPTTMATAQHEEEAEGGEGNAKETRA